MKRLITITALLLLTVGCSSPKISVRAETAFTQQAMRQAGNRVTRYGTTADGINFFLSLPPPPSVAINHPPIITPAPGAPDPYGPLLAFLQAGPNGSVITRSHLVQLTPATLSLAQLWISGTVTLSQLFNSAQAWQLMFAAQPILAPLGLWNQQSLQQWQSYIGTRLQQLVGIAVNLHNNIVAPPLPGQPTITQVPPTIISINQAEVIQHLALLAAADNWLALGNQFPDTLFPLIRHVGFSKPVFLLYGSRRNYYGISASTTRVENGHLSVVNLNQEGYFKNDYASGAGRYFQGQDDISLSYFPVEFNNSKIKTLDVEASDRFGLLKRLSGGNVDLLHRTFTHNTAALSVDAAFNNRHLRIVGGITPYSSMGGVMGEITYKTEYLEGRIGGGVLVESALHGNTDTFLGFIDTEHTLSTTPRVIIESKNEERALFTWATLTLSASTMVDRSLTHQTTGRRLTNKWGFQGDIRLIPELHTQLDADYFSLYAYGGVTNAVVPAGRVDLDHPGRSVALRRIRTHFGLKLRVLVSKAVKNHKNKQFGHTLYADAAFVVELSELVRRWRFTTDFTYDQLRIGFVGEGETFHGLGIDTLRLGGRLKFMNAYIEGLKSLELDDFQLRAGIEFKL